MLTEPTARPEVYDENIFKLLLDYEEEVMGLEGFSSIPIHFLPFGRAQTGGQAGRRRLRPYDGCVRDGAIENSDQGKMR